MAAKKVMGRQFPAVAVCDVGPADMANGYDIVVPPGGYLRALAVQTITAFNSETTAVMTISDGTTTFVNAVDLTSTGAETVANVPKFYPSGGTLAVRPTQTGAAATAGRTLVFADIVGINRVNEGA